MEHHISNGAPHNCHTLIAEGRRAQISHNLNIPPPLRQP